MQSAVAEQESDLHLGREDGLDFLWLELTDKCNMACVHCYADSSPALPMFTGMRIGDWKRVLDESFDLGCRNVQFIGGEPTIHPDIIELIEHSRVLGYELVEVFTNGTAFSPRIREALALFRVDLAFSVYAAEAPIHDSITGLSGSFAKTIDSIRWAIREGLGVRVAIIAMQQNAHVIESTRTYLEQLGVTAIRVDETRGVGRGSITKHSTSPVEELCGKCWQGRLCVTPSGDMYPCVFSRSWLVGTVADGVKSVVNGDRLHAFRSMLRLRVEDGSQAACGPQCGPDCPPATCGPQCSP